MKKLPTWALYIADAICIVTAILIAGTYYSVGLPMEAETAFLCTFMIASGAAIICTSQILHFKYTKLAKEKNETKLNSNIEENFQILFKQVSAIKRDNSTLNANFTALLNRYNEKKEVNSAEVEKALHTLDALKAKIEELENRFAKEEDLATLKLEVEESIENFKADVEIDLTKLDDIDSAVKDLKNTIEEICDNVEVEAIEEDLEAECEEEEETESEEAEVKVESKELEDDADDFEEEAEDIQDTTEDFQDLEDIEQKFEELSSPQEEEETETELAERTEDFEDFDELEEDAEYTDGFEDDGVDPSDDLSQIGLMSRALNNTQQSQSILDRFAKIDEKTEKADEDEAKEASFVDIEDDFSDIDDDLADILNLANEEDSQEAVLYLNAMLGLGNKPYIRGAAQGLSETQGVQMEFVEIGKWRYVFDNLSEKAKVSIWLNDEIISQNGDIYIDAGETLEIDANF